MSLAGLTATGAIGGGGSSPGFFEGLLDLARLISEGFSTPLGGFLVDQALFAPAREESQALFEGRTQEQIDQRNNIFFGSGGLGLPGQQSPIEELNRRLASTPRQGSDSGIDPRISDFLSGPFGQGNVPPTQLEQVEALGTDLSQRGEAFFNNDAVLGRFNELFDPIRRDLRGNEIAFRASNQRAQEDFQGSFDRASAISQGLGNQERTDINERFDSISSVQQAGLAARGLGGTTAGFSTSALNERERGGELRRLRDDLAREQLGIEETFGLGAADARERLNLTNFNAASGTQAALGGIATGSFNAQNQGFQALMQLIFESGSLGPQFAQQNARDFLGSQFQFASPQGVGVNPVPNFGQT